MIKRLQIVLIFIIFLLITQQYAFGLNANDIGSHYIHETWQRERGLPFESVLDVTQTRDGFIWLALGRGVARFDGVRFTYFNHSNTSEIPNTSFINALEDRNGNLWFGSDAGLLRYRNGEFKLYTKRHGLPADAVTALFEDSSGNFWIGTDHAFARWTGDGFKVFDHPRIRRVYTFGETNDGGIFISSPTDVYLVRDTAFDVEPFLQQPNVFDILTDRAGRTWMASSSGLLCLSNGQTKLYTIKDGLPTNYVNRLTEDGDGSLWIGTTSGIVRWNGSTFDLFDSERGLSDDGVNGIYRDREGGLWVATNGGLDYLRPNSFAAYNRKNGLSDNHVWAVYEDRAQNIWIGTNGGGLNRVSGGSATSFRVADGMPSDKILSIQETSDGAILAGTDKGIALVRGDRVSNFEPAPDSREWSVYGFLEDNDGSLWIGTRNHGLIHLRNGQIARYTTENGLPNNRARNLTFDKSGGMWVATGKLNYLRDGKIIRSWGEQEGIKETVYGLYQDGSRLWIGTYSGGLYLLDGNRLTSFSRAETELSQMILSVLEDDDGNLWLSYESGLQRVNKKELLEYAAGTKHSFNVMTFDRGDGLVNNEFNATGKNAGWKLSDGRLIFANISGAVVFNPKNIKPNTENPPVFITEVIYNHNQIALNREIELPPGANNLEISYSAPFFASPSRIRFKYKLEGFDKEWTDAGRRRTAYYMNLPPGNYRFRVMSTNGSGVWKEVGSGLEFRLLPAFYQTLWFVALSSIVGVLGVFGLYRLRVHHLKRNARFLEQQVDERTKALQAEVAVREKAEESLRTARDDLENQVRRRTAELANANSILSEQREFLYVTLASVCDAVIAADEKGLVTFLNPVAETLTGWQNVEAVNQPLSSILRFSERNGETEKYLSVLEILSKAGSSAERGQAGLQKRDGNLIPINYHVSQIHQKQKQDTGIVITFWDLRPQIAAEAERRKLEEQLFHAQKMESIGTLAGGVAHDFNNLLTIVLGNADLMRMTLPPNDPLVSRVSEISQAAHRGAEVTRQLLTFSRQQPLERRPVELTRVLSDLFKLLNRIIGENVEIRVEHAPDLPPVFADSAQLGQVFMNLLVNSRDAMPSGGVIRIETSGVWLDEEFCRQNGWARAGRFVRADVSDQGIGMDEETLARIFDPFYTTKELGKGTGLGLAVVYGIVEQHNGFINVTSKIGSGTTFSVFLPVAEANAAEATEKNSGGSVSGHHETILLAEDEEMLRELAREILESSNYRVFTAADGVEAVELYRQHPDEIDLLLFDASMPRMNGLEAYKQISQINRRARVLFVTGYSEEFFQQTDFDSSSDRTVLLKPYEPEMLLNKIRELLDAEQTPAGNFEPNNTAINFS